MFPHQLQYETEAWRADYETSGERPYSDFHLVTSPTCPQWCHGLHLTSMRDWQEGGSLEQEQGLGKGLTQTGEKAGNLPDY